MPPAEAVRPQPKPLSKPQAQSQSKPQPKDPPSPTEHAHQAASQARSARSYGQDVGPFLTQTTRYMGVDPKDLFKDLNGLNGTELNSLLLTLHGRDSVRDYDKNRLPQFTDDAVRGGASLFWRSGAVPDYQQHLVYDDQFIGIRAGGKFFEGTTRADEQRLQDTHHKLVWDAKTHGTWEDGQYFPTLTAADVARANSGVQRPG